MDTRHAAASFAFVLGLLGAACGRDQTATGTTTLTSTQLGISSVPLAVERIVGTRCNRERACIELGLGSTSSEVTCLGAATPSMAESLTRACANGVDRQRLDACLDAVEAQPCPLQAGFVGRIPACSVGALCAEAQTLRPMRPLP